jgi:uncharacterized integral membrane protein
MTTQGPAPVGGRASAPGLPKSGRSGSFTPRRVVALVLLVLAVVFVVENRDLTEIRLLIPVVLMPLWAALVITLIIGLVVGLIVGRQRR